MLFRRDKAGIIAISQPSHAWLSGQLARCWGNDRFLAPAPYEEVCLGAEQHDIAWLPWERRPTLDRATGLPHDFRAIDVETRVALWSAGIDAALAFGLYPALLVSLHAHTIHALLARSKTSTGDGSAPDPGRRKMEAFLDAQQLFRRELLESLAAQPRYRQFATRAVAERNRRLLYAVDRISLEICWGVRDTVIIPAVSPDGVSTCDLRLSCRNGKPHDLIVDPWPFATPTCAVVCEGRRLDGRFRDEISMREALADPAACVMIEAELRPR